MLVHWHMIESERFRNKASDVEDGAETWREGPIDFDAEGNAYWCVGGRRRR